MIDEKQPLVRHRDETPVADWPFGRMQRIVTGGEGGVANVSVAATDGLPPFFHTGYDEVYYVVSGEGTVTLDGERPPIAARQRRGDSGGRVARLGRLMRAGRWSSSSSARRRWPSTMRGRSRGGRDGSLDGGKAYHGDTETTEEKR